MAKTIIFDRVAGNFIITSQTDYSVLTDINLSVPIDGGVEIDIDGSSYWDNSSITSVDYTIDVSASPTNVVTMVATIPLPKDNDGNIVAGEYEIFTYDRYTESGGGTAIYNGDVNLFTYSGQVNKSACINQSYSCVAPSITLYDTTDYAVGTVEPTVESAVLVLNYPSTSGISPITATTLPLQIDTATVYTKDYNISEDITLLYDFTDYQERINVLAEGGFNVKCDTLCSVSKCINSFKEEMDKAEGYNDVKYQKMLADYNKIMSISTQVMIENSCDKRDNIPALLNEITDIINASSCKTNCDGSCDISGVSERVYGLGNAVSGDSLLNTNNGIVFSPQTAEIVFSPDGLDFTSDGAGKVTVEAQVKPSDIVSQAYIDSQDDLRVLKSGDTMIGALNGTDINLTGTLDVNTIDVVDLDVIGAISGTTAGFSGGLSGTSADFSGNVKAGSAISFSTTVLALSETGDSLILNQSGDKDFTQIGGGVNKQVLPLVSSGSGTVDLGTPAFKWKRFFLNDTLSGTTAEFSGDVIVPTAPTIGSHLTNKTYSDAQDALKVSKSGDTMTGTLNGDNISLTGTIDSDVVSTGALLLNDGGGNFDKFVASDGSAFEVGDGSFRLTFAALDVPDYDGKQFQLQDGGSTLNRPASPPNFKQYFDTDLNGGKGYLIIYNNGDWFDPMGNIV